MADLTCSVPGCERIVKATGWCGPHYRRWHTYGDVRADVPIKVFHRGLSLEQTFRRYMPEEPPAPGVVWAWRGSVDRNGYGKLAHGGRSFWAHRVSYQIFHGAIPEGMFVRHCNDTPIDVNPWNLEVGTHLDNMADMRARGRQHHQRRFGIENNHARLTDDTVREIRQLYATGEWTQAALGQRFSVTRETVREVIHYRTWRHV